MQNHRISSARLGLAPCRLACTAASKTLTPDAEAGLECPALSSIELSVPTRLIKPRRWLALNLPELWQYRELVWFLAVRDLKVRYKQTLLGAAWAILQPVVTMLVFTVLFGAIMGRGNQPSPEGVPYYVSTFTALVPWTLFAYTFMQAGNSLLANKGMITKVYFPRLIIPISTVLAGLADFGLAFLVLVGLMLWVGVVPGMAVLMVPVLVVMAVLSALALALWLSALNVMYRDVKYLIPFISQIIMFTTPVVYPASVMLDQLPRWGQILYSLNPMMGVVEGFRWALLGTPAPDPSLLALSGGVIVLLLIGGVYYFRKMETSFADVI
jgi:lipopolysaccharide transport system permease protein